MIYSVITITDGGADHAEMTRLEVVAMLEGSPFWQKDRLEFIKWSAWTYAGSMFNWSNGWIFKRER